jgi:hypothetical protein
MQEMILKREILTPGLKKKKKKEKYSEPEPLPLLAGN